MSEKPCKSGGSGGFEIFALCGVVYLNQVEHNILVAEFCCPVTTLAANVFNGLHSIVLSNLILLWLQEPASLCVHKSIELILMPLAFSSPWFVLLPGHCIDGA